MVACFEDQGSLKRHSKHTPTLIICRMAPHARPRAGRQVRVAGSSTATMLIADTRTRAATMRKKTARISDYRVTKARKAGRAFRAWDAAHMRQHDVVGPLPSGGPVEITDHVVDQGEWGCLANPISAVVSQQNDLSATILGDRLVGLKCKWCNQAGRPLGPNNCRSRAKATMTKRSCGPRCRLSFARANFRHRAWSPLVEIRHSGDAGIGYGAYVCAGQRIREGDWLGEYLGQLRPIDPHLRRDAFAGVTSAYVFYVEPKTAPDGMCQIDAQRYGNWTRFVNSHCRPNVEARIEMIGQRHCILLRALRDIVGGQELFLNYGREYFELLSKACRCDRLPWPHLPRGVVEPGVGRRASDRRRLARTGDENVKGGGCVLVQRLSCGSDSSGSGSERRGNKSVDKAEEDDEDEVMENGADDPATGSAARCSRGGEARGLKKLGSSKSITGGICCRLFGWWRF